MLEFQIHLNLADGPVDIGARPLRPSASEGNRRLPRAQVYSTTTDITVSGPGKALIQVRDPRPSRPPARKRRNETQAFVVDVTFKCYGADVMVGSGSNAVCDGP